MNDPRTTGIRQAVDTLGSRAAVARVVGVSRQAVNDMVDKGFVISVTQREHILKIRRACPGITVAALCGIAESRQEVE